VNTLAALLGLAIAALFLGPSIAIAIILAFGK
jgi:hypothetical protein